MSIGSLPPPRRVRHQARDALSVMGFSAAVSVTLTVVVLLLSAVGH